MHINQNRIPIIMVKIIVIGYLINKMIKTIKVIKTRNRLLKDLRNL